MRDNRPNPDLYDEQDDCFESIGAILGYFHQKYGPKTLNELLTMADLDSEDLEKAAGELTIVGLKKAAAIVRKAVSNAPSRLDRCPYEAGSTNAKSWLASERWRMQRQA